MKLFKPEPHKRVKDRKKREERAVIKTVRPAVVTRDGLCRLRSMCRAFQLMFGACAGPSEWAHWREHSRAKTRGMAPQIRHTTSQSLMMCKRHHNDYDKGHGVTRLYIEALTERICDGRLRFIKGECSHDERELG